MSTLEAKITISAVDKVTAVVKSIGSSLDKLKLATRSLNSAWGNFSSAGSEVVSKIRNISLAAFGAGTAIFGFTKHYAEMSEELLKSSQRIGISTDKLQKLQYVAKLAGVSTDDMNVSLKFLNRSIVNAATNPTSNAAIAFNSMGVSVHDATGKLKDVNTIMMEVSDVFKRNEDGPKKVATALALMGRGGTALIPIMNQGADAIKRQEEELQKYGHVLSNTELEQGKSFEDSYRKMTTAITGIGQTIAIQLMPVIQPFLDSMREWIVANKLLIADKIKQYIIDFSAALKTVWVNLKAIKDFIWPVIDALGGFKAIIGFLAGLYIARFTLSLINLGIGLFQVVRAIGAFSLAILSSPIAWIIGLIALLGVGLYELYKHWDRVKQIMISIWPAVKPYFETFLSVVTLGMYNVAKSIYDNWDKIKPYLVATWQFIKDSAQYYFGTMAIAIMQVWAKIRPYVSAVWEGIKADTKAYLDYYLSYYGTTFDALYAKIAGVFGSIKNSIYEFVDFIKKPFEKLGSMFDGLINKFIAIKNAIMGGVNPMTAIQQQINPEKNNPKLTAQYVNTYQGIGNFQASPTETKLSSLAPQQTNKLDIYMKVDADGRPQKVTAKSPQPISFTANTGLMLP